MMAGNYKKWNSKQKIHIKAAKNRQKKVEKNIDRLLIGCCAILCLVAALADSGVFSGSDQ